MGGHLILGELHHVVTQPQPPLGLQRFSPLADEHLTQPGYTGHELFQLAQTPGDVLQGGPLPVDGRPVGIQGANIRQQGFETIG